MNRLIVGLLGGLFLWVGGDEKSAAPAKAAPPAELAKLQRFVGNWTGTATMVEPSAEEMKKKMPPGSPEMPAEMKGTNKAEWALNGMFLKQDGCHEGMMGKECYVEYITWDPEVKKYRSWWFSDTGEFGDGTMTLDADGKTFKYEGKGMNTKGEKMTGTGTVAFKDDTTQEWTWSMTGPMGKMSLKGTSKKGK